MRSLVASLAVEGWRYAEELARCGECLTGLVLAATFLCMTPITHGVFGRWLHAENWGVRKNTFRGGSRFVLLSGLSWAAWATSVVSLAAAAVVVLKAWSHEELPSPVLSGASVCGAVISEVLMVSSLLMFQVRRNTYFLQREEPL